MRSFSWLLAALPLGVLSCDSGKEPPTLAPYGLDERPANPTCVAQKRPRLDTGITLQRQWQGLTFQFPLALMQAPNDSSQWFVVERAGRVRAFLADGTGLRDFAGPPVNASGEGGLLGLAFHPSWPQKREAYLSYTRSVTAGDPPVPVCQGSGNPFTSVIARYQSTNNGQSLNIGPDEILKVAQPYSNHNGGDLAFGNDGMLYLGLGDGGSGNDPCAAGQNLGMLLGKMLRIDINAPAGTYNVPPDNPFVGNSAARGEIWALGLRNPWRWSFDRATGEQWVGEVGQSTWEEIDKISKGGNYGWRNCEGFHALGSISNLCRQAGTQLPVVAHGRAEARSITGGYVYRGAAMPSLVGTYIYGDYETGNIWALLYDAQNRATPKLLTTVAAQTLVSFAQGNDGEVYTVQSTGVISKLVPSAPPAADDFPQLLSQTGCFDAKDPKKPAPGLIPFEVNSPLWSDGADKARYLAVPDGSTITIRDDGDWDLPIGSVVAKTFAVDGKPIETRLFMRHDDGGWGGYTYEWNEQGSDAELLPAGKVKAVAGGESWAYPSRSQCMQCHSAASGGTLGLETAQLNRDAVYASTNRLSNQLATLDHIGLFSAPLTQPPTAAPRLADPYAEAEPLEARARSYLHANCSHCHRPEGGGQGTMDLRHDRLLLATNTCNADNTQGAVEGAIKIIAPGNPQGSVLSRRVHAGDAKRMPPISVNVKDPAGSKLLDDWISSITTCP